MLLLPRVHSVQDFAKFELGNGIRCGLSCGMQRKLKLKFNFWISLISIFRRTLSASGV